MGDRVTEYRILRQRFVYYDKPIEEQVTEALAEGYELLGAPFTETIEQPGSWDPGEWQTNRATCQAVVKRSPVFGVVNEGPQGPARGWLARLLPCGLP